MHDSDSFWDLVNKTEKILDELLPLRVVQRQQQKVQNYWDLKEALKEKSEQLKRKRFWQMKEKRELKICIERYKSQLRLFYKEDDVDKIIQYTLEVKDW